MTLLLTEGWRGSATAFSSGRSVAGAASLKGWTVYNPGTSPIVAGTTATNGTTVGSATNGTVNGGFYLKPLKPDGSYVVTGSSFIIGHRITHTADNEAFLIVRDQHTPAGMGTVSGSTLWLGAGGGQTPHLTLIADSTSHSVKVYRGNGSTGTLLGTGTGTPFDGSSHYVEIKVVIHPSAGSVVVHVDQVTVLNLTGINTQGSGVDNTIGSFEWIAGNQITMSDFVLMDTVGTTNNDFLGDVHVETVVATSDGAHLDFTPGTGLGEPATTTPANHWSTVDERPYNHTTDSVNEAVGDSNTDWVESATVGAKDSYGHEAIAAATGTVYAVAVYAVAAKTDTPPRGAKVFIRSGTSESTGADESLLPHQSGPTLGAATADYSHVSGDTAGSSLVAGVFETNPAGGGWTISTVNSSQLGVTVSS